MIVYKGIELLYSRTNVRYPIDHYQIFRSRISCNQPMEIIENHEILLNLRVPRAPSHHPPIIFLCDFSQALINLADRYAEFECQACLQPVSNFPLDSRRYGTERRWELVLSFFCVINANEVSSVHFPPPPIQQTPIPG